ncbi:hypothetical protein FMC70_19655 [Salmonella enterica subsp. enterica serovar Enteritidis]|uniref:hypothetical protein n=1 Tax=Enterobacteriaceae TaxID=543 RepID=UPI001438DDC6|nr:MULTISPECIES: hypothetical protein [Enterobacteriaceae]MBD5926735.1 hypothetical protein [Salmonella enterica subsp. enterica serovar Enteritidis]HAT7511052.1 hypothetical protein [Enterobacter asburiae]MBD5962043.1 hypothetical protein [Salmonella enterica subsp. enterica serovar Enteritidis]MBD6123109.1 hypothetical protein [Salmonella enterica subsp. enterica serovar Enteritidis]MBD6140138.1 hypothetical protein [Salmonella enterica subsp. enterica serovar Enteritidis]
MKYFLIKPFRVGLVENSLNVKESDQYVIIDLISGEEILYCDDNCFLITPRLLKSLKENNLTGVNVLKPKNMKFSVEHNMQYPNKKLRDWYRLIPFKYEHDKNQEIFIDHNNNLIINERIKKIILSHRVIRASITEYKIDDVEDYIEEEIEQEVFKKEPKRNYKEILTFLIIMFTIMYLFFK